MSKRRPYVRPMDGWWKKNPFYVEYMVHEGTALFVAAYAITLLVAVAYHAFTWFKLFPLTMPPIVINGKKVAPCVVVGSGWAAAVVAAVALFGLVWGIAA